MLRSMRFIYMGKHECNIYCCSIVISCCFVISMLLCCNKYILGVTATFCTQLELIWRYRTVSGPMRWKDERRLPVVGQPASLLLPLSERVPLLQDLPSQWDLQRVDSQMRWVIDRQLSSIVVISLNIPLKLYSFESSEINWGSLFSFIVNILQSYVGYSF